jgi:hypothetical protein
VTTNTSDHAEPVLRATTVRVLFVGFRYYMGTMSTAQVMNCQFSYLEFLSSSSP